MHWLLEGPGCPPGPSPISSSSVIFFDIINPIIMNMFYEKEFNEIIHGDKKYEVFSLVEVVKAQGFQCSELVVQVFGNQDSVNSFQMF